MRLTLARDQNDEPERQELNIHEVRPVGCTRGLGCGFWTIETGRSSALRQCPEPDCRHAKSRESAD
jgi:hypothetical protein